jgi:hypothetical protein
VLQARLASQLTFDALITHELTAYRILLTLLAEVSLSMNRYFPHCRFYNSGPSNGICGITSSDSGHVRQFAVFLLLHVEDAVVRIIL